MRICFCYILSFEGSHRSFAALEAQTLSSNILKGEILAIQMYTRVCVNLRLLAVVLSVGGSHVYM